MLPTPSDGCFNNDGKNFHKDIFKVFSFMFAVRLVRYAAQIPRLLFVFLSVLLFFAPELCLVILLYRMQIIFENFVSIFIPKE